MCTLTRHSGGERHCLYNLGNGAPLCQVKTRVCEPTDRVLLCVDQPITRVYIWDPHAPDRPSEIDFRDWTPICRVADTIVAERGEEFLFWNFSLASGVRTLKPFAWDASARLWCRHGVILLNSNSAEALYVLPLDDSHTPLDAPHPTALPDVPYHHARAVCASEPDMRPASASAASSLPLVTQVRSEVWRCT